MCKRAKKIFQVYNHIWEPGTKHGITTPVVIIGINKLEVVDFEALCGHIKAFLIQEQVSP